MTFCIITHVAHGFQNGQYFAYSPYVREMNIWSKYVGKIIVVAPLNLKDKTAIDLDYSHQNIAFSQVSSYHFLSLKAALQSLFKLTL